MPSLRLPSAEVSYRVDGSGPPLLLLHGAGGNSLVWFRQIDAFSRAFTCYALDQPGFGRSTWSAAPVEYCTVIAELAEHFGWRRLAVLGHSLGGWAALRLALRLPDRVAALVLSSSWAGIQSPEILASLAAREAELTEAREAWRERRAGSHHPAVSARFLSERPDLHWLAEGISEYNGEGAQMAWDPAWATIMVPETRLAELRGWSIPTLCLAGSEELFVPPRAMRLVAKELPGALLVEIPRSGHWTFLEQAEAFNAAVVEFLGAHAR